MSWLKPPLVSQVSGSDVYLREREIRKARSGSLKSGRLIREVEGADELESALSAAEWCVDPSTIFVRGKMTKGMVTQLEEHLASKDSRIAVVVVGNEGVSLDAVKGVKRLTFEAPKPWEEGDRAIRFVQLEAQRYGLRMGEDLAKEVVTVLGTTDLGMLSFEVLKYGLRAKRMGSDQIDRVHVRGLMSVMGTDEYDGLIKALEGRDVKAVLRAMESLMKGGGRDKGLIPLCRSLGSVVMGWIFVRDCLDHGVTSEEEIAGRIGWKPARVRFVIPVARRWSVVSSRALLAVLSKGEKVQVSGAVSPWVVFESELVKVLVSDDGKPGVFGGSRDLQ